MQLGTGKVKFFSVRGWGFITPSDGGPDVYLHVSELPGEKGKRWIAEGELVSYEIGIRNGRPAARNVRALGDDGAQ